MIAFSIPETIVPVDDNLFLEICRKNPENQIERTQKGEIIVMTPTGGETGKWNASIIGVFYNWNRIHKLGKIFDSSTAFRLPSSAIRSPDLSFVFSARWNALQSWEKESFPPLCPDFVLELRSKTDNLKDLQSKMEEWIENGCKLAWLLDMDNLKFYIYKPSGNVQILEGKNTNLLDEDVLTGFTLSIAELLNDM
jgi:Uma2 family endonuclease